MVKISRVYDKSPEQGRKYLVDRIWPRGLRKEDLGLTAWLKAVAPTTELRKWFSHDPDRWEEFKSRFRQELLQSREAQEILDKLAAESREGDEITLLFSARDRERNNAVVLKEIVEEKQKG